MATLNDGADAAALDRLVGDLYLEYEGMERFCRTIPVPSEAESGSFLRRIEQAAAKVKAAEVAQFWVDHLLETLRSLRFKVEMDLGMPYRYLNRLTESLDFLVVGHPGTVSERAVLATAKSSRGPDVMREVVRLLGDSGPRARAESVDSARVLKSTCMMAARFFWEHGAPAAAGPMDRLSRMCDDFGVQVASLGPAGQDYAVDYRRLLAEGYGLSLDWILSWCEDALAREREELHRIAAAIDSHRTPSQILREDLGAYPVPEEMFGAMNGYLAAARRAALDYVTLPDGEKCDVLPMRDLGQQAAPWGGYAEGDLFLRVPRGRVSLNVGNFRNITRGRCGRFLGLHA